MMTNPTPTQHDHCTCRHYPDCRALNRDCPIHGDQAEAARRARAEREQLTRRAAQ